MEAWRIALARWGDPLWSLALLASRRREDALPALVGALSRVYGGDEPPGDQALDRVYDALMQHARTKVRSTRRARSRHLPPTIATLDPADRVMIGLWLLRGVDGERLAQRAGMQPSALVSCLRDLLTPDDSGPRAPLECTQHLTIWLETQLGFRPPVMSAALCPRCQPVREAWRDIIEAWRDDLRMVGDERVPDGTADAIDRALDELHQERPVWWRRRAVLLAALVLGVVALLAGLLVIQPRLYAGRAANTAAQRIAARDLVAAALREWQSAPAAGSRHLRVTAIETDVHSSDPTVTEIWLTGESARHRVEMYRGSRLIEWQVGDGSAEFSYGAALGESSCPWNRGLGNRMPSIDVRYTASADQQRAALAARMRQGAIGTGYRALERAMTANLRSFGVRVEGQRTYALIGYSDADGQDVLLLIDPRTSRLRAVQTLALGAGRSQPRDLWRVEIDEDVEASPLVGAPETVKLQLDQLIDPACPSLIPPRIASLRTLVGISGRSWYLPRALPAGIDRGLLYAPTWPLNPPASYLWSQSYTAVLLGPDRWLRISAARWQPNVSLISDVQRGPWRVAIQQDSSGIWQGTIRRTQNPATPAFVPLIDITAHGWRHDEILALISSLSPVDTRTWLALDSAFVDAHPLTDSAQATLEQATRALAPVADRAVSSEALLTQRVPPPMALPDPYHADWEQRLPARLRLQYWMERASPTDRYGLIATRDDGSLYSAQWSDGNTLVYDDRANGWIGSESNVRVGAETTPDEPALKLLHALLHSDAPIDMRVVGDERELTQQIAVDDSQLNAVLGDADLPTPWVYDLAAGDVIRRLQLGADSVPRWLETVYRGRDGREIQLQRIELIERREHTAAPAIDVRTAFAAPPDDVLTFAATAFRWRTAYSVRPLLSIHWLMSSTNFDTGSRSDLTDRSLIESPISRVLTWSPSETVWQLQPVTGLDFINIGMLQYSTWHDLSNLSALHRTAYVLNDGPQITVTQGPRRLIRNMLRYASPGDGWTRSYRVQATIDGKTRDGWLLADDRGNAALVIEIDNLMLHVIGPEEYLAGTLLDELRRMSWEDLPF